MDKMLPGVALEEPEAVTFLRDTEKPEQLYWLRMEASSRAALAARA
ncbi:hypothetical protein [Rubrobacter indicoceani]|nr:hypothetical protein [Rubrobacter indicoceani]